VWWKKRKVQKRKRGDTQEFPEDQQENGDIMGGRVGLKKGGLISLGS